MIFVEACRECNEGRRNVVRIMFEAFVLVCMIGNSDVCHTLKDLEGPYKTKQECIVRTYEMAADLPDYMPTFQALKYKCFEDKDSDKMRI